MVHTRLACYDQTYTYFFNCKHLDFFFDFLTTAVHQYILMVGAVSNDKSGQRTDACVQSMKLLLVLLPPLLLSPLTYWLAHSLSSVKKVARRTLLPLLPLLLRSSEQGAPPLPAPPSPNSPCSGSRCCSERVVPAEGRHRATSSCHDTAQRRIQVVFSNTTFPPLSATPSTPGHIAYVKYAMVAGAPGSSPSPSAALCFHVGIRPRRAPRLCRTRSMFCSCSPICPCVHGFLHGWMCITTGD